MLLSALGQIMASFVARASKRDSKGKDKVTPPLPPPESIEGMKANPLNISLPKLRTGISPFLCFKQTLSYPNQPR
jgi:hypothetical protein